MKARWSSASALRAGELSPFNAAAQLAAMAASAAARAGSAQIIFSATVLACPQSNEAASDPPASLPPAAKAVDQRRRDRGEQDKRGRVRAAQTRRLLLT